MADGSRTLGQRIIKAAHLAAAIHLYQSACDTVYTGQQVTIGGAGPDLFREGALPPADGRLARSRRFAEGAAE